MSNQKNTLDKNTVPEGFTLQLAVVDMLPVIFFGGTLLTVSSFFGSRLFLIGSLLIFIGGLGKALWKLVIALAHKNAWFLNR